MQVHGGRSYQEDPIAAVAEATAEAPLDLQPDLVIAFVSMKQEVSVVVSALQARFAGSLVVGCTTAGEILDGDRGTGSLIVSALKTPGVRWAATLMRDLRGTPNVGGTVARLCGELGCDLETYTPNTYFAMLLIDGMSGREEMISAALSEALCGIPLVGGSAADGLAFQRTQVFANGEVDSNAAVVILAHTNNGFDLLKHQHYARTPRSFVVTSAVAAQRRVNEFDGRPAAEVYAELLGVTPEQIAGTVNPITFMNPVLFSCNGDVYVRSVQRVDPDGSMLFHSAIDEGIVLEIAGRTDIREALKSAVDEHLAKHGKAELFIGFNCILRALELDQLGDPQLLADEWRRTAAHTIGFDTYGEIWNGLHINQTLVGIGLYAPATTST